MAEKHLDHPGYWQWTHPERGPATVLGYCPHQCDHNEQWTIAWGPDERRYELVECVAQCESTCRAWTDGSARMTSRWMHVAL